ncbi:unnamed protein product [Rhizophagus irregularis]|uniref:Protein kinase domain-containing protein n=1 Tax=Rhizophagus irregularis TaxID=588596 RepID=A0A915ZRJ2_9GLOM|nr:unnamed protein product [Rhizophagus irregularis]
MGLETIHNESFMHRDFHSGNILFDSDDTYKNGKWKTGDLGLSQAVNNKSSNDEVYGVIPYIAPEIFKGSEFTKEADIYSLEFLMENDPKLQKIHQNCSSIYSIIPSDSNYISRLGNNTNTISLSSQNLNSTIQNFSSSLDSNYISKELELDIESLSTQNLNSTIQNFSTSKYISAELELDIESLSSTNQNFQTSLVKRRIESLNVETHDDSGKYVKK